MTSMVAIAIPYVSVRLGLGGIQIYGCMMVLALATAIVTAVLTHRRFAVGSNDIAILVPVAIAAAVVFGSAASARLPNRGLRAGPGQHARPDG